MDFQNEVNKKLNALNKDLQERLIFKDFTPLSKGDFENYLTGKSFDVNEFIIYLAEEYADDQRVTNAVNEFGHEGLVDKFKDLQTDICAYDRSAAPDDDQELVEKIVEFTLRVFLEDLEELAAYVYLMQNPGELEHFEDLESDLTEFLRKHGQDNPIEFNFNEDQKMDNTKVFTVEKFQELLNREDWDHKTSVEEYDRFEEDGHDVSFGYVTNVSTLKSESLKIEFTKSYKYSDYQPDSFEYGDNGLLPSVSVEGFDVVDEGGNTLDDFDIQRLLYSDFTEFEDGGMYPRLNDEIEVGQGPETITICRDYAPDLEVHYFDTYGYSDKTWDSISWYNVDIYALENDRIVISVQTRSKHGGETPTNTAEVFNKNEYDKIKSWLQETLINDIDAELIEEIIDDLKE